MVCFKPTDCDQGILMRGPRRNPLVLYDFSHRIVRVSRSKFDGIELFFMWHESCPSFSASKKVHEKLFGIFFSIWISEILIPKQIFFDSKKKFEWKKFPEIADGEKELSNLKVIIVWRWPKVWSFQELRTLGSLPTDHNYDLSSSE